MKMFLAVLLAVICAAEGVSAQGRANLTSDGPFVDGCSSSNLLPASTLVYLMWDLGAPGPDSADVSPCGPGKVCYPEDPHLSYTVFFMESNGIFYSPPLTYMPPTFPTSTGYYLAIFFGDDDDSCYTSPTFSFPVATDSIRRIDLPLAVWQCGAAHIVKPVCGDSMTLSFGLGGNFVAEQCLHVCGEQFSYVVVTAAGRNPHRPPLLRYSPGCAEFCGRVDSLREDFRWWWLSLADSTWFVPFAVFGDGCVSVQLRAAVAAVYLDTMTVTGAGAVVTIRWQTAAEAALDHFTVWRATPHGDKLSPRMNVTAQNSATGAPYTVTDTLLAENIGTAVSYLVEAVTAADEHYPLYFERMDSAHWILPVPPAASPLPLRIELLPAYPNPFNATTRIAYELKQAGRVQLDILNLLGQRVVTLADEMQTAGRHEVAFAGRELSSGVYFCRLQTNGTTIQQKLLLLK